MALTHPNEALFIGEKPFPMIPVCEHFAGSEKLITKALGLQETLGPVFNITCDCEDGAAAGQEQEHAEMIVRILNSEANQFKMAGSRIHDFTHPHWKKDVDILVAGAGNVLSYITIPKSTNVEQPEEMIAYIQKVAKIIILIVIFQFMCLLKRMELSLMYITLQNFLGYKCWILGLWTLSAVTMEPYLHQRCEVQINLIIGYYQELKAKWLLQR